MRRVITLLLTIAMALSLVVVANATSTVKQSVYLKTEKVENNDNTVTYTFTLDASKCDGVAAMEFIVETTGLTYAKEKEYYPEGAELKRVFQPENFNGGGNKPLGFYPDTNKFLAFGGSAAEGRILKGEVKVVALTYNINASNYDLKVTSFKACYSGDQAALETTRYNCVIGDGVLKGDVNGDGKVNGTDALWVSQYFVGARQLTDAQKTAADVNHDGKINGTDALWIAQYFVGSRSW